MRNKRSVSSKLPVLLVLFNDTEVADPLSLPAIQKKERDMAIMTGIFKIGFQLAIAICSKISNPKQGSWNC